MHICFMYSAYFIFILHIQYVDFIKFVEFKKFSVQGLHVLFDFFICMHQVAVFVLNVNQALPLSLLLLHPLIQIQFIRISQ